MKQKTKLKSTLTAYIAIGLKFYNRYVPNRKYWAAFLLINLLFSIASTFSPIPIKAGPSTNKITFKYFPKQGIVADSQSTLMQWDKPENAFIPDLTFNNQLSTFSESNSAILRLASSVPQNILNNALAHTDESNQNLPTSTPFETSQSSNATTSADSNTAATTDQSGELMNASTTPNDASVITSGEGSSETVSTGTISAQADEILPVDLNNMGHLDSPSLDSSSTSSLSTEHIDDERAPIPNDSSSTATQNLENNVGITQEASSSQASTSVQTQLPGDNTVTMQAATVEYSELTLDSNAQEDVPTAQPDNLWLKLSIAGHSLPGGLLEAQYSVGTSTWQTAGTVSFDAEQSNFSRNNFATFPLPISLIENISNVHLRFVYEAPQENLQHSLDRTLVYLDGLWLESEYGQNSKTDDSSQVDESSLSRNPETFHHFNFNTDGLDLSLPGDLSNPFVLKAPGASSTLPLQMLIVGVSSGTVATRLDNTITYADAFKNTDLEYKASDTGLKENIILKNSDSPEKFRYALNIDQYDYDQTAPNRIMLYKKGHKGQPLFKLFTLSAPIMTDASGTTSTNLVFKLNHKTLTLIPDKQWLQSAVFPVVIDPNIELNILNVSSFPVQGEFWTIDFTTQGLGDLQVTPADPETINEMQFSSLTCDDAAMPATVGDANVVASKNWTCDGLGEIKFLDLKTGHHHMAFDFAGVTEDAYNGSNTWNGNAGDGKWETPGNWSANAVPTSADDVVISSATTVNIASGTTVNSLTIGNSGGGVASTLNFNFDAIGSGTPLTTLGNVTVYSGASIIHATGTSAVAGTINISVGGSATITGSINADGRGYTGGNGPGVGSGSTNGGGGSYGGVGGYANGSNNGNGGSPYGSSTAPTNLGSGGGNGANTGGNGGGAIKLFVIGNLTVSGSISAKGNNTVSGGIGSAGGAGSGGSIYLSANTLLGSGTISAVGGAGGCGSFCISTGGGGGGGRVAIYYTTDSSSWTVNNYGGGGGGIGALFQYGGAGTTFKKSVAETYGDLTLDNNSQGGSTEDFFASSTPIGISVFDTITVTKAGGLSLSASSATTTTLNLTNNSYLETTPGTRLNYVSLNAASTTLRDLGGGLPLLDQNQDLTIPSGMRLIFSVPNTTRTYNNLTINGILTHAYNNGATTTTPVSSLNKINWNVTGNLAIASTGQVNVDGRGYTSQNGPGAATTTQSGIGASYGGLGGVSSYSSTTPPGPTYGSSTAPTDLGSGGASGACSEAGGTGGGAVKFNVTGNAIINGIISAKGTNNFTGLCLEPGGGSGGSIYIIAADFSGSGTLTAVGGEGSFSSGGSGNDSGGGGGGRIAVAFTSNPNNAVLRSVLGGYQGHPTSTVGGLGTVYPTDLPTLTTESPTSIADTSIQAHGTITSLAFYPITQYGHVISTLAFPTTTSSVSTTQLGAVSATGTYAHLLTGLTHDTSYHIRSYATTLAGTVYGNDFVFVTDAPAILTQVDYKFFQNANSLQPGSALAVQDAPAAIYSGTTTPVRLRLGLSASTDFLPAGVGQFKLQVSTSTSSGWIDVGGSAGSWWNTSWSNRRKITFNNASSSSDLVDFPVLVMLNATSSGNIDYSKTKAGGADIRFVASDNSTQLPYEIEKWDTSATSSVWIKVPTIHASSSADFIYMYYNNPSATDGQTATSVWDSNYGGVWHLSGSNYTGDSTSNSNTGTNSNSVASSTGFIDGAGSFVSASSQSIDLGLATSTKPSHTGSVSIWVKPSTLANWETPISNGNLHNDRNGFTIWSTSAGLYTFELANGSNAQQTNFGTLSTGQWSFLESTWDGSTIRTYLNGQLANSQGQTLDSVSTSDLRLGVDGAVSLSNFYFNGLLDEARVSTTTRSADYILAEYKTDTGQFNSYNSEELKANIVVPAAWSFYSNNTVASGTTVSSLLLTTSNVQETYEQSNPTVITPNQISVGQAGEWDFSLIPNLATAGSTYYFRMVNSNGTALDFYSNYPQITLVPDNAPNAPTALGPGSVTGGGYITTNAPSFTYSLSDPDATDTVQSEVQVSTSSNFSGIVFDYTSALQSQGAGTTTVGQAAGGGTYNVGSAATRLGDSSSGYYWRVLTTDLHGLSSTATVAHAGAVAFKVDATAPQTGVMNLSALSSSSISASLPNATDTTSGLAAVPYILYNTTQGTNSLATSSNSWLSTGLSVNTQYTFVTAVTDATGNTNTSSNASAYTLANSPTSLATTSVARTSISLAWSANSNPAGTSYILENITAATSATTTATTTIYSGLICNTSYSFRVKALNGDGISTTYSSTVTQVTSACNVAPNAPTSLGPSNVIAGSSITNHAPAFTYTLNDSDASDTVGSRIIIATTSNFSNPIIDYTSSLAAQGSASFTVGQSAGGGTYATGALGQTLDDGSYYWKVQAIDSNGATSSYAVANSGAVAFIVTTPIVNSNNSSSNQNSGAAGVVLINPLQNNNPSSSTNSILSQNNPENYGLTINLGQPITDNQRVVLQIVSSVPAAAVIISNNPDFSNGLQMPYNPTVNWDLCQGLDICSIGQHPVYVKYLSITGQVLGVATDAIELTSLAPMAPEQTSSGLVALPQSYGNNSSSASSSSSAIGSHPSSPSASSPSTLPHIGGSPSGNSYHASTSTRSDTNKLVTANSLVTYILAPIALAVTVALNILPNLANLGSLQDVWLFIIRLLYWLIGLFGLRKKPKYWGTVYDSKTKQPLDPVIVKLIDVASGEVVAQAITDLAGRFGFFVRPGKFRITAEKTHYQFPSQLLTKNTDGVFDNLYYGDSIELTGVSDVISPNIPMDSLAFDWNQQDKLSKIKFHPKLERFLYISSTTLFWFGFIFCGITALSLGSNGSIAMFVVYIVFAVAKLFSGRMRLWGRVTSASQPVAGLFLTLSPKVMPDVLLNKALTDESGRFFLKSAPGEFTLRVLRFKGAGNTPDNTLASSALTVADNGVVNKDITVA